VDQHGNWKLEPVARSIFSNPDHRPRCVTHRGRHHGHHLSVHPAWY
jgi:hypothetical protein